MCNAAASESGQLLTIQPCGWYLKLQSDRDRLAGVVKGMEEQNARNIEALKREEEEITRLRRALDLLGVPAQAGKDPDKAPPLRIDVRMAREVMEAVDGI